MKSGACIATALASAPMSEPLTQFVQTLLETGQAAFWGRPEPPRTASAELIALLKREYHRERLRRPGVSPPFAAATAARAAELTRQACWFLASRDEAVEIVQRRIRLAIADPTPSDHASADLTLRYLPVIHRRARNLRPDDPLAQALSDLLRAFPLSGVLSAVAEPPTVSLEFGGSMALMMDYAERWAANPKPEWRPTSGVARDCADWAEIEFKAKSNE